MEALAQDLGDANLFMTTNMDCRSWPDVRRLIHLLEHGTEMPRDLPYELDTERFTELMNKYAPHLSVYLCRKVKIFHRAFLTDICAISEVDESDDWSDRLKHGWYWSRVEFTETRGTYLFYKFSNVFP